MSYGWSSAMTSPWTPEANIRGRGFLGRGGGRDRCLRNPVVIRRLGWITQARQQPEGRRQSAEADGGGPI